MSSVPKDFPPPPPFQVYSHRQASHHPPNDSLLVPNPPHLLASVVELDFPIAFRNGIRFTRNPSPHYTALSYHQLSQPFYTCLPSISYVSVKSVGDALAHPGWCQTMLDNKCSSDQWNLGTCSFTF